MTIQRRLVLAASNWLFSMGHRQIKRYPTRCWHYKDDRKNNHDDFVVLALIIINLAAKLEAFIQTGQRRPLKSLARSEPYMRSIATFCSHGEKEGQLL
jgi:hypothetical protein